MNAQPLRAKRRFTVLLRRAATFACLGLILGLVSPLRAATSAAESLVEIQSLYRSGQYETALAAARETLATLPADDLRHRILLLEAISKNHLKREDWTAALEHIETARQLATQLDDPLLHTSTLLQLGAVFLTVRDFETALSYCHQALETAQITGDASEISHCLNQIAIIHWQTENHPLAERYLRRAARLSSPDPLLRHVLLNNIGVTALEQGRFDEAETLFLQAEDFLTENEHNNPHFYNLVRSNLADLAQRRGEINGALELSAQVLAEADRLSSRYLETRTQRHRGNALRQVSRYAEAETAYLASIAAAQALPDLTEEMQTWRQLVSLYESNERYTEALAAYRALSKIRNEVLSLQVRVQSLHLDLQYETQRREREIAELQRTQRLALVEAERDRLDVEQKARLVELLREQGRVETFRRNFVLILLACALLLLALLIHRYRYRQRTIHTLASQRDELQTHRRELERANEALRSLNRDKDDILSIAAHDLQTPLITQQGYAELLRDTWAELKPAEIEEFTSAITTSAETMRTIIHNLLESHRLEQGAVSLNLETLEPSAPIRLAFEQMRPGAEAKRQTLRFETRERLPPVRIDPHYFQRILQNLLSNAIKYSPPATAIDFRAEPTPARGLRISVTDRGVGIPLDEQPRLFQKFARLSPRPTGGETSTGLGLSIVKRLAELQGGTIHVHSLPGQGSTFTLEFPPA